MHMIIPIHGKFFHHLSQHSAESFEIIYSFVEREMWSRFSVPGISEGLFMEDILTQVCVTNGSSQKSVEFRWYLLVI